MLVELAARGQLVRVHANASELFGSYFLKKESCKQQIDRPSLWSNFCFSSYFGQHGLLTLNSFACGSNVQITSETLTNLHQCAVCKAISQLWMFYGHNNVPKMLQLTFIRVNVHICRGLCVVWKYIFVVHFSIWRSARQDLHGYDISPTLWAIVCINSLSFYQVTLLCRMNGVGVYLTLVILSRSGNCDRRGSEYLPHPQHGGSYILVEGLISDFLCIMSFTANVNVVSMQVFVHVLLVQAFNSVWLFTGILADTHWLNGFLQIKTHTSRTFKSEKNKTGTSRFHPVA